MALLVGFYVGWNTGSNDAANAMGVPIGGRLISYRKAIVILILFVLLGAVLEGGRVMETVGAGIVVSSGVANPLTEIPQIAIIALFSAGLWVTIATTLKLPVSTSQSIVGSVIGAGLFLSYVNLPATPEVSVNLNVVLEIGVAWVLTPIAAAIFAYILYKIVGGFLRGVESPTTLNKILSISVIFASAFAAYSIGANTVGNATGLIYAVVGGGAESFLWNPQLIGLFGGIALCTGVITYSRRVIETVGVGITNLRAISAFSAQLGAALTVWIFARLAVPVSSSVAIVGGVAGVGLVKGTAAVSKRKLGEIVVAWILTPSSAAVLTFVIGLLVFGG